MSIKSRLLTYGVATGLASAAAGIAVLEGYSADVYEDSGGVATVCYGSTQFPDKLKFTEQECLELLLQDTRRFYNAVQEDAPEDAPASVVAALTSVAYNVGVQGYKVSPMRTALVQGDYIGACTGITAPWRTSKGTAMGYRATVNLVPHKGLENRRQKEYSLCVSFLYRS